jgi:hypothetical protein
MAAIIKKATAGIKHYRHRVIHACGKNHDLAPIGLFLDGQWLSSDHLSNIGNILPISWLFRVEV